MISVASFLLMAATMGNAPMDTVNYAPINDVDTVWLPGGSITSGSANDEAPRWEYVATNYGVYHITIPSWFGFILHIVAIFAVVAFCIAVAKALDWWFLKPRRQLQQLIADTDELKQWAEKNHEDVVDTYNELIKIVPDDDEEKDKV